MMVAIGMCNQFELSTRYVYNVCVCYKKRNGFSVIICEQCRIIRIHDMCKYIFVVIFNDCMKRPHTNVKHIDKKKYKFNRNQLEVVEL